MSDFENEVMQRITDLERVMGNIVATRERAEKRLTGAESTMSWGRAVILAVFVLTTAAIGIGWAW